ncbi:hypothetical protein DXG01_010863 [Tephrocybe rancida]|nr:hypothetical protein DXG01_010863 [Tephrocybe rancida]
MSDHVIRVAPRRSLASQKFWQLPTVRASCITLIQDHAHIELLQWLGAKFLQGLLVDLLSEYRWLPDSFSQVITATFDIICMTQLTSKAFLTALLGLCKIQVNGSDGDPGNNGRLFGTIFGIFALERPRGIVKGWFKTVFGPFVHCAVNAFIAHYRASTGFPFPFRASHFSSKTRRVPGFFTSQSPENNFLALSPRRRDPAPRHRPSSRGRDPSRYSIYNQGNGKGSDQWSRPSHPARLCSGAGRRRVSVELLVIGRLVGVEHDQGLVFDHCGGETLAPTSFKDAHATGHEAPADIAPPACPKDKGALDLDTPAQDLARPGVAPLCDPTLIIGRNGPEGAAVDFSLAGQALIPPAYYKDKRTMLNPYTLAHDPAGFKIVPLRDPNLVIGRNGPEGAAAGLNSAARALVRPAFRKDKGTALDPSILAQDLVGFRIAHPFDPILTILGRNGPEGGAADLAPVGRTPIPPALPQGKEALGPDAPAQDPRGFGVVQSNVLAPAPAISPDPEEVPAVALAPRCLANRPAGHYRGRLGLLRLPNSARGHPTVTGQK